MESLDTDQLTDLVGKRLKCISRLRDLSRRQQQLIRDSDMDKLLGLLAAKKRLFDALGQVDRQLDPFRAQDPEKRPWRCVEDRQRCARAVQCCDRLLSEIRQLERQSEQLLITRRDELAATLQGAHTAQTARGAYAAHTTLGAASVTPLKSA